MSNKVRTALILSSIPLFFAGAAALGGEGVQVKVTNDGTQDIVVTVYDMSSREPRVVLENERINGFTSVPINALSDASGRAVLSWRATSTDRTTPACGHDDGVQINDSSSLNVHADSSCT
jgi:hypothetical protein